MVMIKTLQKAVLAALMLYGGGVQAVAQEIKDTVAVTVVSGADTTENDADAYNPYVDEMEDEIDRVVRKYNSYSSRSADFDLTHSEGFIDAIGSVFGLGVVAIVLLCIIPLIPILLIVLIVIYLIRRDRRDSASARYSAPIGGEGVHSQAESVEAPRHPVASAARNAVEKKQDRNIRNMIIGVGLWLIGWYMSWTIWKVVGLVMLLWSVADYVVKRRELRRREQDGTPYERDEPNNNDNPDTSE